MPRGRPRKQPDPLTHQIAVRLTDQEHAAFCQLAAGRFLTPAELARELIRMQIADESTTQQHPRKQISYS